MAASSNMDVKHVKRKMIAERIDTDPVAKRGMAVTRGTLLGLLFLRLGLFVFEMIYYSTAELEIRVISNLLLLPLLVLLYMIYDGNRGVAPILLVSALVRAVWLFSSVYPTLPASGGANAYMGVYLAVMAYQFAVTLLMTAYNPSIVYFNKMQSINMELGAALRGGTPPASVSTQGSSKKKKKKR